MVTALEEIRHFPMGTYTETCGQIVTSVEGTEISNLVDAVG